MDRLDDVIEYILCAVRCLLFNTPPALPPTSLLPFHHLSSLYLSSTSNRKPQKPCPLGKDTPTVAPAPTARYTSPYSYKLTITRTKTYTEVLYYLSIDTSIQWQYMLIKPALGQPLLFP